MNLLDILEKDRSAIKRLKKQVQFIIDNVDVLQKGCRIGDMYHAEFESLNSDLMIFKNAKLLFVLSSDLMLSKHGFNSISTQKGSTELYLSQGAQNNVQKCFSSTVQSPFVFKTDDAMELLELSEEVLFQYTTMYNPNEIRYMYAVKHYVQEFEDLRYLLVRINTMHIGALEDYISKVVKGVKGYR